MRDCSDYKLASNLNRRNLHITGRDKRDAIFNFVFVRKLHTDRPYPAEMFRSKAWIEKPLYTVKKRTAAHTQNFKQKYYHNLKGAWRNRKDSHTNKVNCTSKILGLERYDQHISVEKQKHRPVIYENKLERFQLKRRV